MARKCYRQNLAAVLFSLVSSSGGGLPGRPELERVSGRSLFLAIFSAGDCGVPEFPTYAHCIGMPIFILCCRVSLSGAEVCNRGLLSRHSLKNSQAAPLVSE